MKYINCEQGTEEWFAARIGVITASMFSVARSRVGELDEKQLKYVTAILSGMTEKDALIESGYKSAPTSENVRLALAGKPIGKPSDAAMNYAFKIAMERISGETTDDKYQTYAMKRGNELEADARSLYIERTGSTVSQTGVVLTDCGNFGYSSDGLVDERGAIEVKCLVSAKSILPVFAGDLSEFNDQMQGGMMINEREWCDFVLYLPQLKKINKEIYIRRVRRNEAYITALRRDLEVFNNLVWSFINKLAA